MKMKTPILLLSILEITHPFPLHSPLRATSSTLRYRTSEYGESDGRVSRYGGGDDRVSVLNLLEAQSVNGGRSVSWTETMTVVYYSLTPMATV